MGNSTSGRSWPRDVRDLFRSNSRTGRRHGRHDDRSSRHQGGPTGVDDRPEPEVADGGRVGSTQRGGGGNGGNGRTNYNKLNSCPDLQLVARTGYTEQHRGRQRNDVDQPPMKLNVKIYRSYRFMLLLLVLPKHTAANIYYVLKLSVIYSDCFNSCYFKMIIYMPTTI